MKQFAFAALDAEAAGGDSMADNRQCDWADCACEGAHPAPRSRESLRDRYWFCKEHAREYNRAWNYYAGMSAEEIERERRRDTIWQRPTWPFSRAIIWAGPCGSRRKPGGRASGKQAARR